jgi:Fe-S oxidoreductase
MEPVFYMPGCAFELYKKETSEKFMAYLRKHFPIIQRYDTCCRHELTLPKGSHIIFVCSSCAMRLKKQNPALKLQSLWNVIHTFGDYPLPDYHGLKVSVHDSCTAKATPIIHSDVRQLLRDMNLDLVEAERHGMNSQCCGNSLYPDHSPEEVLAAMKKRAASMPCENVVVYCVSCMNAIKRGGRTPRLLTDLVLGEETIPPKDSIDDWYGKLTKYIERH